MATKQPAPTTPDMPDGFNEGGTPDVDGWYKSEKDSVVTGTLAGHIVMKGDQGPRQVVLITLGAPCKAYEKGDDKGKMLEAGQVIGVSVSHDIREILEYVEYRGKVWLCPVEKKKLSGGKTMWKFKQGYKGRKGTPPSINSVDAASGSTGDDDDIPF